MDKVDIVDVAIPAQHDDQYPTHEISPDFGTHAVTCTPLSNSSTSSSVNFSPKLVKTYLSSPCPMYPLPSLSNTLNPLMNSSTGGGGEGESVREGDTRTSASPRSHNTRLGRLLRGVQREDETYRQFQRVRILQDGAGCQGRCRS